MLDVSVKAVLFTALGEVILLENERGEWELPGGRIEPGESEQTCLAREIAEELGAEVVLGVHLDRYRFEVVPGRFVWISTYVGYLEDVGRLRISAEHRRFGRFGPQALPARLPAGYCQSIASALEFGPKAPGWAVDADCAQRLKAPPLGRSPTR
jgi:8-oxo-dGTP pyrophosphatase MutT (NUDIX family)